MSRVGLGGGAGGSSAPNLSRADVEWLPSAAGAGSLASANKVARANSPGNLMRVPTMLSQAATELIRPSSQGAVARPPSRPSSLVSGAKASLGLQTSLSAPQLGDQAQMDADVALCAPVPRSVRRSVQALERRLSSEFRELEAAQEAEAIAAASGMSSPAAALTITPPMSPATGRRALTSAASTPAMRNVGSPMVSTPGWRRPLSASHFGNAGDSLDDFCPPWRRHPSRSARRENFKKEHYAARIAEASAAAAASARDGGSGGAGGFGNTSDVVDLIPLDAFMDELSGVSQRIDFLGKSMRDDAFGKAAAEAKRRAELEEERRRLEAEQRRLRKKEQEARDPKKKVALKVESKRRFGKDSDADKVPMMSLEVSGDNGHDSIKVVDVRALQRKCMLLDGGGSVDELVALVRSRDKKSGRKLERSPTQATLDSITEDGSYGKTLSGGWKFADEERHRLAADRREEEGLQRTLRRIATMRGGGTSAGFSDIVRQARSSTAEFEIGSARGEADSDTQGSQKSRGKDALHEQIKAMAATFKGGGAARGTVNQLLDTVEKKRIAHSLKKKRGGETNSRPRRTVVAVVDAKGNGLSEEQRKNARRRLGIWMGAVKWHMLYVEVRRKKQAVHVLVNFMDQLGEWARIKMSIKRTLRAIRVLQKASREYLRTMRRRCDIMERDFVRVEERELEAYFRALTQKLWHDEQQKVVGRMGNNSVAMKKFAEGGHVEESLSALSPAQRKAVEKLRLFKELETKAVDTVDWRVCRLSDTDRKALIRSYYTQEMKKKVSLREKFVGVMKEVVVTERELASFFRSLGAGDTNTKDIWHNPSAVAESEKSSKLPFWQMTESVLIMLIAFAADTLVNPNDPLHPLIDHPANKDLLPNPFRRVVAEESGSSAGRSWNRGGRRGEKIYQVIAHRVDRALARRALNSSQSSRPRSPSRPGSPPRKPGSPPRRPASPPRPKSGGKDTLSGIASPADNSDAEGAEQAARIPQGPDLEKILDQFTPRLRDITEDQAKNRGAHRGNTPPAGPRVSTPAFGESSIPRPL